jgi:translation elongation factor EF-1beta
MFVVDHAGKDVEVVCQRVDVSLDKVDAAVAHSIKSCEGAKAALLTEECRVSMGMEMVARTLVRADAKGRYVRVEKELDQTQGIRAKLAGKK